ncbi:MAG: restriction endonuclease subunit S [Proteobacteria bacterium]|nr:restriction endonuclease subunit S [Pseudomonadota bacterium]
MSNELPPGWLSVPLSEICLPVSQRGPDRSKGTFRYIDLGAIDNKKQRIADAKSVPVEGAPSRAKQKVKAGDVVFSTVRVYLENIASVPEDLDGEIASTAFCVLRPPSAIDPRFLYYFVTSRRFVLAVNKLQRGNSPPSVQEGDIRSQAFPLAPTIEHQCIASKIEELFSRIEEGEHALERARKLVELYRQSVLKAAVTGELTSAWREEHKDNLESGDALLQRILMARRAAWEKAELDAMMAKGRRPADDHWKQKYQEPPALDTTGLPALPNGWTYAGIEQLLTLDKDAMKTGPFGSLLQKSEHVAIGVPVLGIENVKARQFVSGSNIHITAEKAEALKGYRAAPGDIVISRSGTVGEVCVIPDGIGEARISTNLMKVTLADSGLLPDMLACQIYGSPTVLRRIREMCKGSTRNFLNQSILRSLPFAVPPLKEQQAILSLLSAAEHNISCLAEPLYAEALKSAALRQAVLGYAFAGKLVKQDPTDEPAYNVLERIAAERCTFDTYPKHNKKNTSG